MPETPQKKVLLVDDDKFLLDMYALKFGKAGYDVKSVDSADAAIALLKGGFAPDAVLIDIVMPGTDGLDLVSSLRAARLASGASIIVKPNTYSYPNCGSNSNTYSRTRICFPACLRRF